MKRVVIEVTQRVTGKVAVRAVRTDDDYPGLTWTTDLARIGVEAHAGLDEQSIWELRQAVESEIKGWAAKLPLDYI